MMTTEQAIQQAIRRADTQARRYQPQKNTGLRICEWCGETTTGKCTCATPQRPDASPLTECLTSLLG